MKLMLPILTGTRSPLPSKSSVSDSSVMLRRTPLRTGVSPITR